MNRWHDLCDPEPTEDYNLVQPETGVEYNYEAVKTFRVFKDLSDCILTRCPQKRGRLPIPRIYL